MRGPGACPGWGATCLLHAVPNGSRCHQDKHKAQYISNRDKRCSLDQLFGALGSHHDDHKLLKALPGFKRLGRWDIALLGFVLVIDLLELPTVDAQPPQQALSAARLPG